MQCFARGGIYQALNNQFTLSNVSQCTAACEIYLAGLQLHSTCTTGDYSDFIIISTLVTPSIAHKQCYNVYLSMCTCD